MKLFVEPLNKEMANAILHWNYEKPYDFYNNEVTIEALMELLDGSYYSIFTAERELVGFFCTGVNAQVSSGNRFGVYKEKALDLGLGMNPNLVGQGNGYEFCSFILKQIENNKESLPVRLTVATFNQRAIHLYEKLGFKPHLKFNTDVSEFITMVK